MTSGVLKPPDQVLLCACRSNADSLKKEDGKEADCSPNVSLKVPACDSDDDVDMEDVGVVVQELRHDKDFNEVGLQGRS